MDQMIANQLQNIVIDLAGVVDRLEHILSKPRELSRTEIAAMAMQGWIAGSYAYSAGPCDLNPNTCAKDAVQYADALLAALDGKDKGISVIGRAEEERDFARTDTYRGRGEHSVVNLEYLVEKALAEVERLKNHLRDQLEINGKLSDTIDKQQRRTT